jgi:hypothetical protein
MRTVLIVAAVALSTSCVTAQESFRSSGLKRAAFDLSCPEAQLSVVELVPNNVNNTAGQVGVSGCGKKAVYVHTPQTGWISNSQAEAQETK